MPQLTLKNLRRYADKFDIEITPVRTGDYRYEVIQCNVPGATMYGCENLSEAVEAVYEITNDSE